MKKKVVIYEITKVDALIPDEEMNKEGKVEPYDDGLVIKILGFTRTKTLGYGGDCYDFHFFKK